MILTHFLRYLYRLWKAVVILATISIVTAPSHFLLECLLCEGEAGQLPKKLAGARSGKYSGCRRICNGLTAIQFVTTVMVCTGALSQ